MTAQTLSSPRLRPFEKRAFRIDEFCALYRTGRTKTYNLIKAGRLEYRSGWRLTPRSEGCRRSFVGTIEDGRSMTRHGPPNGSGQGLNRRYRGQQDGALNTRSEARPRRITITTAHRTHRRNVSTAPLRIVIVPTASRKKWTARLNDRVLCVSAWPFVMSARLLLAEGYPADTMVELWRPNTSEWALRGRLGAVAARFRWPFFLAP